MKISWKTCPALDSIGVPPSQREKRALNRAGAEGLCTHSSSPAHSVDIHSVPGPVPRSL